VKQLLSIPFSPHFIFGYERLCRCFAARWFLFTVSIRDRRLPQFHPSSPCAFLRRARSVFKPVFLPYYTVGRAYPVIRPRPVIYVSPNEQPASCIVWSASLLSHASFMVLTAYPFSISFLFFFFFIFLNFFFCFYFLRPNLLPTSAMFVRSSFPTFTVAVYPLPSFLLDINFHVFFLYTFLILLFRRHTWCIFINFFFKFINYFSNLFC